MVSIFEGCDDSCGWTAAFVAALAYGSFGVPIKQTVHIEVHPLVLQSYKTITMFVLSWCVILMGVSVDWTPWGIISGFLWVIGGTGGIYAIRMAGMAVAVGTWASVMIAVNFVVGIVMFQEPVASHSQTFGAFICLTLGLIGMSHYSAPSQQQHAALPLMKEKREDDSTLMSPSVNVVCSHTLVRMDSYHSQRSDPSSDCNNNNITNENVVTRSSAAAPSTLNTGLLDMTADATIINYTGEGHHSRHPSSSFVPLNMDTECVAAGSSPVMMNHATTDAAGVVIPILMNDHVEFCGVIYTKRAAGIAGAVFNGLMTGSSLIPLHYAKAAGFGGAKYMISFASGALLTNCLIWMIFYLFEVSALNIKNNRKKYEHHQQQSDGGRLRWVEAYYMMPAWHVKELWAPGLAAGVLLTIAMFGTFLSVTYLGQGVGNSIIQSKILISGLWGIFYYKEIKGCATITNWFLAATLTVAGILWLSEQRMAVTAAAAAASNGGGDHRRLIAGVMTTSDGDDYSWLAF